MSCSDLLSNNSCTTIHMIIVSLYAILTQEFGSKSLYCTIKWKLYNDCEICYHSTSKQAFSVLCAMAATKLDTCHYFITINLLILIHNIYIHMHTKIIYTQSYI